MNPKTRKLLKRIPLAVILILLGWFAFEVLRPSPPPPPLPNPNGYDDFVKAGQMMVGEDHYEYMDWTFEQLKDVLAKNAKPLLGLRTGLTRESRIPIKYSADADMQMRTRDLMEIKRLAWLLAAEGRLAELEHRPDDAIKSYLDCMRLGQECCRGGLMIDKLVGTACEVIGARCLSNVVTTLTAKQCRETIAAIERIQTTRESADEVLKAEKRWSRRAYPFIDYCREAIGEIIDKRTLRPMKSAYEDFSKEINNRELPTRGLLLNLALRAYELEKGERPKTIADLVPDYLKTIPLDPLTGTNIVYQP